MARRNSLNTANERNEDTVQTIIATNLGNNATSIDGDRPVQTVDTEEKKEKKGFLKKIAGWSVPKKIATGAATLILIGSLVLGGVALFGGNQTATLPVNPPSVEDPNGGFTEKTEDWVVVAPLTEDQKSAYAEKILADSQVAGNYDPTTVKLEAAKTIENGDADYLVAYISLMTNEGKSVMYAVGLDGITDANDIGSATIRTNGKKKDITVYENISNHITDAEELAKAKDYFKTEAGLDNIDNVYVDIDKGPRAGVYFAAVDYVAINGEEVKEATIEKEGQKYNLGKADLLKEITGLNKTADQGLTK